MDDGYGELAYVCFVPHPPIMVPEVGREHIGQVESTIRAMKEVSLRLAETSPDTLLFITPHGPLSRDVFHLAGMSELKGDLGSFGASQVTFGHTNDLELAEAIQKQALAQGFSVRFTDRWGGLGRRRDPELDHGVMAPLYYLREHLPQVQIVALTYTLIPMENLYTFGALLARVISASGKRVALVASGDMSHRLKPEAPAGYDPMGPVFDRRLVDLLARMEVEGIMELPEEMVEGAGQCGLPSLVVALGALDGRAVKPEVLSYEGPFGVGYLVASLPPGSLQDSRELLPVLKARRLERLERIRSGESLPVRIARETLEAFVREGRLITLPESLPFELQKQAGAFVSLKKFGQLRGCIGTILPSRASVAEEIAINAVNAGTHDPRFEPVRPEELPDLTYSVDILSPPEPVSELGELDPKRYGVIVSQGFRRGLLLPDLEGIDSVEDQVRLAKQKAGIAPDGDCKIERFEVIRYR